MMKKGLVMEGGAMRGMFTAGVIDVMMIPAMSGRIASQSAIFSKLLRTALL